MTRYHARWVVPVSAPPIRDATVVEHEGKIVYVGPRAGAPPGPDHELGEAILLPGLINAHTHLELTLFRGLLDAVPFREWIARLQGAKAAVMTRDRFFDAARLGIVEGLRAGITTYADTCDSGVALDAMRQLGVRGIMYQEVFCPWPDAARVRDAAADLRAKLAALEPLETDLVRLGISPHAPYTVSDPLFALAARAGRPLAVHIAESDAESRLVRDGTGPFADALLARGIPVAPRARSPIALLRALGVLDAHPLLIHAVNVDATDIEAIAASHASVVHCPISNAKLGHGIAPVAELMAAGITVALGSDSMASNDRMDLLEESRAAALAQRARRTCPGALSGRDALTLATLGGARALGLESRVGSLEAGKDADLAAFSLPPGFGGGDPETALVFALGGSPARLVTVKGVPRVIDARLLVGDDALLRRGHETAALLAAHLRGDVSTLDPLPPPPPPPLPPPPPPLAQA